ncbi:GNAT family N-acetyltransferase [Gordonia sp. 'Campus']|uniref:N-acetylglutamate synthase, CG3035 family n=1 Tax=Gordonia sp. 'Campus' TaxID=2915824 RepID=UPI001EE467B4|nr:GNAT family N-acetyltransferase [Gordonia sp. 'Campus']
MKVFRSGAVVGDRVVVRYLLGESTPADWRGDPGAAQSDVTGILIDDADPLRLRRDGEELTIPSTAITSVRLLSAKPVRNSEIRTLEHVAARSWPGVDSDWIDGWFVRSGYGFSRRANSAVPLDRHAHPDGSTLRRIARWYADRGLPPLLALPERLIRPAAIGGVEGVEVQMLTCPISRLVESLDGRRCAAVELGDTPGDSWLAAYADARPADDRHVDAAREVVEAGERLLSFACTADASAIGRGAITESPDGTQWLGLSAMWTDPARRRSGLSSAVAAELVAWGVRHGVDAAYLQVEATNRTAGSWYRRLGFGLHHTYRYLTPDIPPDTEAL